MDTPAHARTHVRTYARSHTHALTRTHAHALTNTQTQTHTNIGYSKYQLYIHFSFQDLLLPYFCITTDITSSRMRVHTDGEPQKLLSVIITILLRYHYQLT